MCTNKLTIGPWGLCHCYTTGALNLNPPPLPTPHLSPSNPLPQFKTKIEAARLRLGSDIFFSSIFAPFGWGKTLLPVAKSVTVYLLIDSLSSLGFPLSLIGSAEAEGEPFICKSPRVPFLVASFLSLISILLTVHF